MYYYKCCRCGDKIGCKDWNVALRRETRKVPCAPCLKGENEYEGSVTTTPDNYTKPKTEEKEEPSKWDLFKKYQRKVWEITESQDLHTLENHDRRGFKDYHLHHKVPIFLAHKLGIDAEMVGSIENLVFIPAEENLEKGYSRTKECDELLKEWGVS